MTSLPLHVIPTRLGVWRVVREGDDRALSEHGNVTEAVGRAHVSGSHEVVVHDRYGRLHVER